MWGIYFSTFKLLLGLLWGKESSTDKKFALCIVEKKVFHTFLSFPVKRTVLL